VTGGPGATGNSALLELWNCTGSTNQTWSQGAPGVPSAGTRDPLKWPFAPYSIWNMPIGSGAVYVPANLPAAPYDPNDPGHASWAPMPGIDWERIILRPTAPITTIAYSDVGWSHNDRCPATVGKTTPTLPIYVPIPADYLVPGNSVGNDSATFLMPNGHTLIQSQPLARCTAGGPGTSKHSSPEEDLYGEGRTGAHGGSNLSAIGGSIRLGELRPGQIGMRHALKVALFGQMDYYNCSLKSECFRWPASVADGHGLGDYGTYNNNQNRAMKMGALLAIPASVDITNIGLESEPGRQLAWTLQNYGAYIVDSYGGAAFGLDVEEGPDVAPLSTGLLGHKREQFFDDWGYNIEARVRDDTPWSHDLQRIVPLLAVVDNNTPTNIGGGGTPRQPIAPVFQ
jgi:hypothetical protein